MDSYWQRKPGGTAEWIYKYGNYLHTFTDWHKKSWHLPVPVINFDPAGKRFEGYETYYDNGELAFDIADSGFMAVVKVKFAAKDDIETGFESLILVTE